MAARRHEISVRGILFGVEHHERDDTLVSTMI